MSPGADSDANSEAEAPCGGPLHLHASPPCQILKLVLQFCIQYVRTCTRYYDVFAVVEQCTYIVGPLQ